MGEGEVMIRVKVGEFGSTLVKVRVEVAECQGEGE